MTVCVFSMPGNAPAAWANSDGSKELFGNMEHCKHDRSASKIAFLFFN